MTEEMLRLLAAQRREKENLLLCIDRAWKDCARQARQARRRLRRLEGVLALTTQEIKLQPDAAAPASEDKSDETQLETLNRRLAAAQQELRQYETRLFACDRTILALKKENAELAALCDKARAQGFIPEEEEESHGPVWPDGLGPAPSDQRPPADQPEEEPDEPAWLDSPMELLEPPEPRQALQPRIQEEPDAPAAPGDASAPAPAREPSARGPLDLMTSEVLGQLDQLMQKEHIPLKKSAYLHGNMD